jgi:ArsR family transcriptional regulator
MSTTKKGKKIDIQMQTRLEARARIIKALAHPTRLFMVEELSQKERCVSELTEMIGSDISTVSKHLSVLKTAGIVQDQKKGSQSYYILRAPCILKFFDCIEEVLEANVKAHLELVRPCCTL